MYNSIDEFDIKKLAIIFDKGSNLLSDHSPLVSGASDLDFNERSVRLRWKYFDMNRGMNQVCFTPFNFHLVFLNTRTIWSRDAHVAVHVLSLSTQQTPSNIQEAHAVIRG